LGGTIAHGFLMLSLLPKLVEKSMLTPEGMVMGINYGFDKVRFLNPVRPGDRVRVTGTVLDIVDKGDGRFLQKLGVSLEIMGKDKPAIVCEWLNMFVVG
jgi:acyl dehydratase